MSCYLLGVISGVLQFLISVYTSPVHVMVPHNFDNFMSSFSLKCENVELKLGTLPCIEIYFSLLYMIIFIYFFICG